jgi:hypothetical protein
MAIVGDSLREKGRTPSHETGERSACAPSLDQAATPWQSLNGRPYCEQVKSTQSTITTDYTDGMDKDRIDIRVIRAIRG